MFDQEIPQSQVKAGRFPFPCEEIRELIAAPPAVERTVLAFARAHPDSFVVC